MGYVCIADLTTLRRTPSHRYLTSGSVSRVYRRFPFSRQIQNIVPGHRVVNNGIRPAEWSDPLYKHIPFYITRHKKTGISYGMFYDNLSASIFDMGSELDNYHGDYIFYFRTGYEVVV